MQSINESSSQVFDINLLFTEWMSQAVVMMQSVGRGQLGQIT